jgi:hypothetical protein
MCERLEQLGCEIFRRALPTERAAKVRRQRWPHPKSSGPATNYQRESEVARLFLLFAPGNPGRHFAGQRQSGASGAFEGRVHSTNLAYLGAA